MPMSVIFMEGGGVDSGIIVLSKYSYSIITDQVFIGLIISTLMKENYYVQKSDLFYLSCFGTWSIQ